MNDNRVIVLAGASSGIGHATALACARTGARLVLAARGIEALERVAQECERLGAEVLVVPTDVTDADAVADLKRAAIDRFGHIDVWVNIVGVGAVGRFDQTPIDAHRRVIETSLIGQMNGAHAALGHFRTRQRGTLIHMISIGGWVPSPYAAAYSAAKFGLRGLTEALRAEVSGLPDVHVCAVYPTFVDTPGISHGANYTGRSLKPPPPLVDPRTVADAIVGLMDAPRATTPVGSVAWPARIAYAVAPETVGTTSRWLIGAALQRADPVGISDGNLYAPSVGTEVDGGHRLAANTKLAAGAVAFGAAALAWWWFGSDRSDDRQRRRTAASHRRD